MTDALSPTSPQPATRTWEAVVDHVETLLADGTIGPRDHLPSERTLAAELGVGRSSVREAFRVLEVLGLMRTQVGSGPASGATIATHPASAMEALMRLQVAAQGFDARDVVRARLVLEAGVIGELAVARTAPDLSAAVALLDAMERTLGDPTAFLTLDARFHVALAEASGNEVLAALMAGLRSAVERYVVDGAGLVESWPQTAERLAREHRAIVAAIAAGDVTRAVASIRAHITGYYVEATLAPDG